MARLARSNRKNDGGAEGMNAILKNSTAVDAQVWQEFLENSAQAAIYALPAYMDIIAPGWKGIEVWRDTKLMAVMPIFPKEKAGFAYALQPAFSQFWGIFFTSDIPANSYKAFSLKRKIVQAVLAAIPTEVKWFLSGFAPEFDYPIPFHWQEYTLQNRYTYRLDLSIGIEAVQKNFGSDTRYDIRKAEKEGIVVQNSTDANGLLKLIAENHDSGKMLLDAAELETLKKLIPYLIQEDRGHLFEAKTSTGELLAAVLTAHFAGKTVYLMSAQSPKGSSSGAMSLNLQMAIATATATSHIFDFEGSMIEGIEGFFRGFGGTPTPYLIIEKNQLPLLVRWARKLR